MSDKIKNIISSIGFLAIGAFFYLQSTGIKIIMKKDLGSGFFPKVIGVSMIIMAVVELALTLFNQKNEGQSGTLEKIEEKAEKEEPAEEIAAEADTDKKGLVLTIVAMCCYAVLFDGLGFILSTILYLFAQITLLSTEKNRNLPLFAGISVAASFIIYGIFVYLIGMPLPTGLLDMI
ncbi:tripartite tricarboxylate transporter TctB family protein [Acidaminococcus fermentans]|uniref:tripartite tricarboxylate transporter TctB family protein n=1 Tax=Acidaminococcus fermentans TaxID=905 RepID=UPI002431704F|nr:tripartite tricarboxylate transporter TctB family protein [Acidaminococcus fermentans]MCI6285300.1 tripartite tricarboxylate transporter TctB family protein [Acidaminococcus fermentans]MDD6288241.1 tripartite tricarboxylate transporter TctB family protein [Acidaminococcus fermentans]MEE0339170.1 tripartite tricarboxylate transporter TctB family protein [Acidaminococcus fermentans]